MDKGTVVNHQGLSPLLGFVVRAGPGDRWQLEHRAIGYLRELAYDEVEALLAGVYDVGELLGGRLVPKGGQHDHQADL